MGLFWLLAAALYYHPFLVITLVGVVITLVGVVMTQRT
jgi:hypothetical protein